MATVELDTDGFNIQMELDLFARKHVLAFHNYSYAYCWGCGKTILFEKVVKRHTRLISEIILSHLTPVEKSNENLPQD